MFQISESNGKQLSLIFNFKNQCLCINTATQQMVENVIYFLKLFHLQNNLFYNYSCFFQIREVVRSKMLDTDTENSSIGHERRRNSRDILNESEATDNNPQKHQESFNNYAKFYDFFVQQNHQRIERLIGQLQKHSHKYVSLIKVLKKILISQYTWFSFIQDEIIRVLLRIVKEKIQFFKINMNQDQKNFYISVLDNNKKLSELIKKQWNIIQKWTIQKLYDLDILSIFFHQALSFVEKCKCKVMPISRDAIKYLFGFSKYQTFRLLSIYKDSQKFLRQIENRAIHQIVNVYYLLVLKNRISYFLRKFGKRKIDQKQYTLQKHQFQKEQSKEAQFYNFCQVAFWSTQKNIQQQPYTKKKEIVQQLEIANAQEDKKNLAKALLFIKIKHNISFDSLWKVQNLIINNLVEQLRLLIQNVKESKVTELSATFPYIFIKDESFDVAFEKSGLSYKYDLKNFDRLSHSKMDSVLIFVRTAFRKMRQLTVKLDCLLSCQRNHKRELIVIKKLVISYRQILGLSKQVIRNVKQDLLCNLILVTNQTRVLSWCVVRNQLRDEKYLRILKIMMKCIRFKPNSVVIWYQTQLDQVPQQRSFYRFFFHFLKTYNIRIYLTNAPLYCKLVRLIFSYIKMQILSKRQLITKQNFYEIVEKRISFNMHFLSRITFHDFC